MKRKSTAESFRFMQPKTVAITLTTVATALFFGQAAAQTDIESTRRALAIIDEFARSMCADPDLKGSTTTASANAKASAGVSKLVKSLADAKVDLSADLKRESFQGLLRTDLLDATKNATNCRLTIFNDLKERVLPRKPSATVSQPFPKPPTERNIAQAQVQSPVKPLPVQPAANIAEAPKHFVKLLDYIGLPKSAKVGWGTPYEDIERLIPSAERTVSRTDAIGFANRTTVNEVPAATVLLFEQRRLTGVRLEFSAGYTERRRGHLIDKDQLDLGSSGDKTKADQACSSKFLGELTKKLDANFSKVADLSCKAVSREEPSSGCSKARNCEAKDTDSSCTAGYKHLEASQISLNYKLSNGKESYLSGYYAYWSNDASCSLQLLFREASTRGGI